MGSFFYASFLQKVLFMHEIEVSKNDLDFFLEEKPI